MKQVTRNIAPESAYDLLERVPRACIAFAAGARPQIQPVTLHWRPPHYLIGVPQSAIDQPGPDQEIVLLVDEGIYYFQLRAIYIRGTVQPAPPAADARAGLTWFELTPTKTIAWDYGTMHEVADEH
ncbi:MAG: hypothetical protein KC519_08395 [Anaerolineae bacterium]|nr:hypothetical protein [Anaerolineae bacterium]